MEKVDFSIVLAAEECEEIMLYIPGIDLLSFRLCSRAIYRLSKVRLGMEGKVIEDLAYNSNGFT